MRSQIAGTAGWAVAAVAVSMFTGILTARALGPESRGTLAIALSIAGVCVLVSALGTNVAVRRHLPRGKVNQRGYIRVTLVLMLPLIVVLFSAVYIVAALMDPRFGQWQIGVAFLGYGLCLYLSNQGLDLVNGLGMVQKSAKINASGSFVCLAFVFLCTVLHLGLEFFIWAYAISALFQSVVCLKIALKSDRNSGSARLGEKLLLRDGIRLLGLNLGQMLTYRSDTVLLGALSAPYQVGIYAVAVTPAAVLRIPANAVGQVLFHRAAADSPDVGSVLKRLSMLVGSLVPIAAIGWVAADWLFPLLFGEAYAGAVTPFRLLLIAEICLAPFLLLSRVLAGSGTTWGASACGLVGVVALLTGGILLIPPMGAEGAALSSIVAYSAMSSLSIMLFLRQGKTRQE